MIHVLIERHIARGMLSTYEQLFNSALRRTFAAHGFISGEGFADAEDENHCFLLCKWRTERDWLLWAQSHQRQELMSAMRPILAVDEKTTVLKN